MHLIIDDKIPFIRGNAERLGTCEYLPGAAITAADAKRADVLIVRTRTLCNRSLLEGSNVKLVVTATIGHDHIDKAYLNHAGIAWANCPGCNATSVAQYVRNALLLASGEGLIDNKWALSAPTTPLTVGIVGVGNVGTAVAQTLTKMGCRVLRCDPPKGEPHSLAQVAELADVVTLHTPLTHNGTHATFHLADEAFFQSLQRRPLFINAARGECADTTAIKRALESGRISGAVIDTWENEPHIDRELLHRAFIATPHIAGYSADGKANGTRRSLEIVAQHFGLSACFDIHLQSVPQNFQYTAFDITDTYYNKAHFSNEALEHLHLYNPLIDTARLRQQPNNFEAQRGNYPFRREEK